MNIIHVVRRVKFQGRGFSICFWLENKKKRIKNDKFLQSQITRSGKLRGKFSDILFIIWYGLKQNFDPIAIKSWGSSLTFVWNILKMSVCFILKRISLDLNLRRIYFILFINIILIIFISLWNLLSLLRIFLEFISFGMRHMIY